MEEKVKRINADCIKVDDGKLIIKDDELANMLSGENEDLFATEEAGLNLCYKCSC